MKTKTNLISREISIKKNCKPENGNEEKESKISYCDEENFLTHIEKQASHLRFNAFNLTTKEIEILASLAKGYSYKMVGKERNIAINTVREHVRNIYQKLNVHSCIEAVMVALREKLLSALFLLQILSHHDAIDTVFSTDYLYLNF